MKGARWRHRRYLSVENRKIATNTANFNARYSIFATKEGILLTPHTHRHRRTPLGNGERNSDQPNAKTDVKWNGSSYPIHTPIRNSLETLYRRQRNLVNCMAIKWFTKCDIDQMAANIHTSTQSPYSVHTHTHIFVCCVDVDLVGRYGCCAGAHSRVLVCAGVRRNMWSEQDTISSWPSKFHTNLLRLLRTPTKFNLLTVFVQFISDTRSHRTESSLACGTGMLSIGAASVRAASFDYSVRLVCEQTQSI